ncbi:MAG TPA: dienelactone hydrolase family protein [Herpetosiphonaceae bacterium]|nr:dienelactone hydrolase family protein [Herpetosiphonaceae bacterium]
MEAFVCRPSSGEPTPAVIIIHEIYGPHEHFDDVACRLASHGYVGFAPDLFWKLGTPEFSDRASFMRFREKLDDPHLLASLDVCVAWLKEQSYVRADRIGMVGFCFGGTYALLETAHNRDIAACVDFYGGMPSIERSEKHPRSPLDAARDIRQPFLGLFGEEDQSIPVQQVRELEGILKENGVPCEFHIYPEAGHAFFNDQRPSYVKPAAEDAWARMLEFYGRYLEA